MANATPDFKAFIAQIADLNIELSQSSEGIFTVCSSSEPLFCFDGYSREELSTQVRNTLASYAKHFFNIDGLGVSTEDVALEERSLPVELTRPVARVKPTFDLAA